MLAALILLLLAVPAGAAAPVLPGLEENDEFAWLEDGTELKVQVWGQAQNAKARSALDALPGRDKLRARLEEWNKVGVIKEAVVRGRRFFYLKRTGLEEQPVLYVKDGLLAPPRAVLDVNRLNAAGTTALDWWYPSPDGLLLAYGLSERGGEDSVLHVREIDSDTDLPDAITRTRRASVAWLPDRSGFFYTRYPRDDAYHRTVYFHRMGDDPIKDGYVFGQGRAKEDWPDLSVSGNGRYLLVSVREGWSKTELYVRRLEADATAFMEVTSGKEAVYQGEVSGDTLYLRTNEDAPRYKLVTVTLKMPFKLFSLEVTANARKRAYWHTLVPEGPFTITGFKLAGGRLALSTLERAASRLRLHTLKGKPIRDIGLPGLGTVSSLGGEPQTGSLAFVYESFLSPPTLYGFDIRRSSTTALDALPAPADLSGFESSQVSYESKDGTPITLFLVHHKRLRRNDDNPTLLTGCGGFDVSMTPTFDPNLMPWLEKGGLYALPNLRGGGEYGEAWHKAGMLGAKQNAFDDLIAAGFWLVRRRYTRPGRLAVIGTGDGGLLAGAAITQAPELFKGAVIASPLLDMLRYDRSPSGRLWVPEYGSPDDPAAFAWLKAYSPYHRVAKALAYPAVLLMSAETGSRVDPMHARKMTAALQKNSSSGLPVLLRLEPGTGAGTLLRCGRVPSLAIPDDGDGKPLSKTLDDWTDRYGFLFRQLGME